MVTPPALHWQRLRLDLTDAALRRLLRLRQHWVGHTARWKQRHGLPPIDAEREAALLQRAHGDAQRLGLDPTLCVELQSLALRASRHSVKDRVQSDGGAPDMPTDLRPSLALRLMRLLPPPQRWSVLLSRVPAQRWQTLSRWLNRQVLAIPLRQGHLREIEGRRLAIEVSDLRLRWVWQPQCDRIDLLPSDTAAESTVRGTACDLLLLASRLEDADTLFFQRRLQLTGDVELGLVTRNLLDRLPWESIPLSARILLQRAARLARAARDAHRSRCAAQSPVATEALRSATGPSS